MSLVAAQLEGVGVARLAVHQRVRHRADANCVRFSLPPRFFLFGSSVAITALGFVVMCNHPFVVRVHGKLEWMF